MWKRYYNSNLINMLYNVQRTQCYISYIYNFSFETQVMLICSFSCGTEILWASLLAQMVMNLPAIQGAPVHPWVGNIPWRREWQSTPAFLPGECYQQRSLAGYIQSMGWQRIGHDWATITFTEILRCSFVALLFHEV